MRGKLLRPSHGEYDETRPAHNGMIDRRPAVIVRCAGVADEISSLRFCRDHELLLSVHGGGHSVPGFAVCGGGLMIDLWPMNSVLVDAGAKTARAEGGTIWGEFDHGTAAFGLATTGGVARPTGAGGFTLGGGLGFLMRKYGLAYDNRISADIVTAEGDLLPIDEDRNPDLFWGIRGGGGNFGIVTSFEFRLHPVKQIHGGMLVFPLDQGKQVLRAFRQVATEGPDEPGMAAGIATHPELGRIAGALDRQQDEEEERLRSAYGPEKYERLVALKNKYDPTSLFRMNQNITPTV